MIPPSCSLVSLIFSAESPMGSNPTFTFAVGQPPTKDLTDIVYTWWHDSYRDEQDNQSTLLRIGCRNELVEAGYDVGENGLRIADSASPQTSCLVQKKTGLVGRQNRGRMYWPFVLPQGEVLRDGTINGVTRSDLQVIATSLFEVLELEGPGMVILHSGSSDPTTVTELQVAAQTGTQRRRNRQ